MPAFGRELPSQEYLHSGTGAQIEHPLATGAIERLDGGFVMRISGGFGVRTSGGFNANPHIRFAGDFLDLADFIQTD